SDNTDLDLHLVTPDGDHVWYGNRSLANGATLDVDVTTGYGPEIIATPTPQKGPYLVYVNYFGGGYGSSEDGAEQA
ncbi:YfaP family protein, partial [Salmonella enterica]